MDRRAPLLLVNEPAQVSSGLQPDRFALMRPLWELGENAKFYQGKVARLLPPALAYETDGTSGMRGLSQHQDTSGVRWIWSSEETGKLHRWYGPAEELIHTFASFQADQTSLGPATYVDFVHWGNWTLANSGIGAIQRFVPGTGIAALPNAPTNVVRIIKRQNQLLALGSDSTDREVAFSDADDITTWAGAADNLAGTIAIEELDTGIRAGEKLAGNIACYAEDQLAMVYWIGAPFYYGARVMLDGIGAIGKMAVCSDGPLNYGVSRNGIWMTDGQTFRYIDQGILSGYLQENVNWAQGSKIIAARNDVNRCIEFHFPMGDETEVSEAWSFDPATQGWGNPVPMQVMTERRLLSKPLGAKDGRVYLLEDDEGAEGVLALRTKPLLLQAQNGHPLRSACIVDELELFVKTVSNVEVRYGVSDRLNGPWDWSSWFEINAEISAIQHDLSISGVLHKLEFRSTADEWSLDLQGFALYGSQDGGKGDRP